MFLYVRFDTKIHHKFHFRSDSKCRKSRWKHNTNTSQQQRQQHSQHPTTATSQSLWGKINFYFKLHFTLIDSNQISMPFLHYHFGDYSTKFRKNKLSNTQTQAQTFPTEIEKKTKHTQIFIWKLLAFRVKMPESTESTCDSIRESKRSKGWFSNRIAICYANTNEHRC